MYKGSLSDGTLVAVKKLERVLPHGEKEFITEVNTIGSMHHMNLVRLCGYCSEASQRYAVVLGFQFYALIHYYIKNCIMYSIIRIPYMSILLVLALQAFGL